MVTGAGTTTGSAGVVGTGVTIGAGGKTRSTAGSIRSAVFRPHQVRLAQPVTNAMPIHAISVVPFGSEFFTATSFLRCADFDLPRKALRRVIPSVPTCLRQRFRAGNPCPFLLRKATPRRVSPPGRQIPSRTGYWAALA